MLLLNFRLNWLVLKDKCGHPNNCKFKWDATEQGLILGGFSIGYTTTQFIGGILSQRVGGKWVFGPAIFLSSMLNFLLPVMTINFGIPAIMAVRVVQGMIQGPEFPALYTISAKWLPAPEKNRMLSFIMTGEFEHKHHLLIDVKVVWYLSYWSNFFTKNIHLPLKLF